MIGTIRILACAAALSLCAMAARAEQLGFAGSVTWFGQVPIMVAIDKGFFKELGCRRRVPGDPQFQRPPGLG
jgi:ABC-type nitrate/sulfonate/bicarbonate transport system substrate-binding protein